MTHQIRLSRNELSTILAALQFWSEEIVSYGDSFARPYLAAVKCQDAQSLSERDIQNLLTRLQDVINKQ